MVIMALGKNMKKTYQGKETLKLRKYVTNKQSILERTGQVLAKESISEDGYSFNSKIIEERMLSGTFQF